MKQKMKKKMLISGSICLLLLLILFSTPTQEFLQSLQGKRYPERPIELIVSFKEGGGTDIGARLLAGYLSKELGQPVQIRNIDGNDGEIGFERLAKANPDGYTIGFINLPTFISLPIQRQTSYQVNDVRPVANYVMDPAVLVVRSDSDWATFQDWVAACMSEPYKMTVSNNGVAASNHIAAAYLAHKAFIELTHVPFGGTADMLKALEEGIVDASVAKVSEVALGVRQKELRVLASFTEERLDFLPETPTLREMGYDIVFGSARALAVPRGTPEEIVLRISEAFRLTFDDSEHLEAAQAVQLPLLYMDEEGTVNYMEEQERYLKTIMPQIGM
ncbi:tripartite tricarboxylate transporter substrate binding protein [Anoxynatronum buryatiense]|uniref:Tripartite-type tricarboxylate transporter, receptor component TctC n=1 Tax=Anoxynatronum buryatiense TaxID=489973 RepID=A0AA45WTN5_9CLOT|nr:tripartite tricarboxylate transporter substrate binding protein [Anoxynatronum buryatiense]SMP44034.1 Tripartite-type tricarboxylate transporter, receptor component TctC [Anoxynatronum buryatiense]